MARVAGRPFLELLLMQLRRNGFQRVILALGCQQEAIRSYPESSPLGTGGALRNAAQLLESDDVLTMNGDSYTDAGLPQLVVDHRESKADVSIVVVPCGGRSDGGPVQVGPSGRMTRHILHEIQAGLQVSLEHELFPRCLQQGRYINTFISFGRCVQIGTPERYWNGQDALSNVELSAIAGGRENQL